MAEVFEVEANGQIYEVEADTPQQAATYARLLAAREQSVGQATAGAEQRNRQAQGTPAYPHLPLGVEMDLGTTEGKINAGIAAIPVAHGLVTAPLATVTGIGTGMVGEEAGNRFGRKLEEYGAPEGTSKVLGMAGGLGAGIYGGVKSNQVINWLKNMRPGGLLGAALEGVAPKAAATATSSKAAGEVTEEAAKKAALAFEKQQAEIAAIRANADKAQAEAARVAARQAQEAERHELQKQLLQRRLEGKAPLASPRSRAPKPAAPAAPAPSRQATAAEPDVVLPDDAVSVVAEPTAAKTVAPKVAPFDQTAARGDAAVIAEQIQQKSGILRSGVTPDGKKIVAQELAKLPETTRAEVEAILARGQAHPATTYQPTPGTPKPAPYKPSGKPLDNPLLEAARKEGSKPGRMWGEKIYLEVDSAGNPVRILNGPQAAAALERRGVKTTWVKNLWGEQHGGRAGALSAED